jgi:hypothetical protein
MAPEAAVDEALSTGAAVLLLRLETSGGGYLTKKNLWTGLGAIPRFHRGAPPSPTFSWTGRTDTCWQRT